MAAGHVTERFVRLPFMLIIVTIGDAVWYQARASRRTSGIRCCSSVSVRALAFAIRFLSAYCIGLLSFWFTQATAIDDLYYVVCSVPDRQFRTADLLSAGGPAR